MLMEVKIKKLNCDAVIPTRGSEYAAGYDLYACLDTPTVKIEPHTTFMINTGLAIEIPDGYFGGIFARSGMASKQGLRPSNCVGVIDSDYRGACKVALHNDSDTTQIVEQHMRVAQLIVMPYLAVEFTEVDELSDTKRADGGFGSSGTK